MTLYAPPTSSALDEETARAELYGVLALLYYAAPSPALIAQLCAAATEAPAAGALLEEPWRVLVGMARSLPDGAIAQEFDALFGGIGKPEVYLYGSHFLSGFLNEKPLARLRTDLAALGLARDDAMSETEDHVACLCEVMRYLIAGDDVAVANLSRQREF
ncbi:MAG: molecular chaperone, partial [Betaproteobacteria bacterium]|nr:molecular chaperone [Betaproteobacteria bacterium]